MVLGCGELATDGCGVVGVGGGARVVGGGVPSGRGVGGGVGTAGSHEVVIWTGYYVML